MEGNLIPNLEEVFAIFICPPYSRLRKIHMKAMNIQCRRVCICIGLSGVIVLMVIGYVKYPDSVV